MARTIILQQRPTTGGLNPAYTAAAADGHAFYANDHTTLEVVNASASSVNATFDTPGTVDSGALPQKVVAIPAGETRLFNFAGKFSLYRQADGTVWVDISVITSVTIAVIQS